MKTYLALLIFLFSCLIGSIQSKPVHLFNGHIEEETIKESLKTTKPVFNFQETTLKNIQKSEIRIITPWWKNHQTKHEIKDKKQAAGWLWSVEKKW